MLTNNSNSSLFIAAYNRIDRALRMQYNFKASMSFSDVVRQTVSRNLIVAKYEDELYDFSRLRNAIVHKSFTDFVIAEPHDETVKIIEHIAQLITTPPRVLDTVANTKVISLQSNQKLIEAVLIISKEEISNIPVYENTKLIGVINTRIITENIGFAVQEKQDLNTFVNSTEIGNILNGRRDHYFITDSTITVSDALKNFAENSKLQIIIITSTGNFLGKPLGVISTGDIIKMNKILEDY